MHDAVLKKMPSVQPITGALYDNAAIFGGRLRVTAFGRFYNSTTEEEDWTFSNLRTPEDGKEKDSSLRRYLPQIAKEVGFKELLVPSPVDFNARVCWEKELDTRIPMGGRLTVRRGTNADGCRLQPGQAYALSAAGCAAIAACHPVDPHPHEKVKIAVGHAGLKSLVDEQAALVGLPSRKPESITENLLTSMGCSGIKTSRRKRVGVVIILPIPSSEFTHPWAHPEWGGDNKRRCGYIAEKWGKSCLPGDEQDGRIELHELITMQFTSLGVPLAHITLLRTRDLFWKTKWQGKEIWYSTRGEFSKRRNLIILKHNKIITPAP